MATINDDDKFLVNNGTTTETISFSDLQAGVVLTGSDKFVVSDGTKTETITYDQFLDGSVLNSTDVFLINDGIKTETITWGEIQSNLVSPPVIESVTLTEDDSTGDRYTNKSFTTTVVLASPGQPLATKAIRGTLGRDLKYKFGPISNVVDKTVTYSDPANFFSTTGTIQFADRAFNGTFGKNGSSDNNFAQTQETALGMSMTFVFPEPLFIDEGVELGLPCSTMDILKLVYKIDGTEYTTEFQADSIRDNVNNKPGTLDLPGGLVATSSLVKVKEPAIRDQAAYEKYLKPYLVPGDDPQCKIAYITIIEGPFELLTVEDKTSSSTARAKVFGFWLGDRWLNDADGATELFFDNSQAADVAKVSTGDFIEEVGNGNDGTGIVRLTNYIGDPLGSTSNKILLTSIEPNWNVGSDVERVIDPSSGTSNVYLNLDSDLNVISVQEAETAFTPFTGDTAQIKFGATLGGVDAPDDVIPQGALIQTEVLATNGVNPDSQEESNSILPGFSFYQTLYSANPADVLLATTIHLGLESVCAHCT